MLRVYLNNGVNDQIAIDKSFIELNATYPQGIFLHGVVNSKRQSYPGYGFAFTVGPVCQYLDSVLTKM